MDMKPSWLSLDLVDNALKLEDFVLDTDGECLVTEHAVYEL